jgi:metallothionein
MASTNKCKHPACSCTVPEGEKYCSPACEGAGEITELACQCNHPGCRGEALR